jgi:hemolysin activation/secretion protein
MPVFTPPTELPPAIVQPPAVVQQQPTQPEAVAVTHKSHGILYRVRGDKFLGAAAITKALDSAGDPKQAVGALYQAYQRAGHFLVAIGGKQDSPQQFTLEIINGKITETDIPDDLHRFYGGIEQRDDITSSDVIRRSALAEAYATREGQKLTAGFGPAAEFGGSKYTLTEAPLPGADRWNMGLSFGNYGNRYSSRWLKNADLAVRPGWGTEFTAGYSEGIPGLDSDSRGSVYRRTSAGGSIVTPWGIYGASWDKVQYKIGDIAKPLNPYGDITTWRLNGSQLAYADANTRWNLHQTFVHVDNTVTVFNNLFTLTDQQYNYLDLGTGLNRSFDWLGRRTNVGLDIGLTHGLSNRSGTFNPPAAGAPEPEFKTYSASLSFDHALPYQLHASASMAGRWSEDTLPSQEQWVLGGFGNLSAYLPSVLVGDSGFLGRALLSSPSWRWEGFQVSSNLFLETGGTQSHYRAPGTPDWQRLSDAGIALNLSHSLGTNLSLSSAVPVESGNVASTLRHKDRSYFYLQLLQRF